ncbi:tryptophan halogenase family protein [Paraglaciecola aquimarina]|uniref:Tryptophan halogenase family protein n=1 Tax=Paraglaciecola aquimarina TaxID=1235557 RepID=A0ABU3SYI0_9ALTE|nr:tryptophan halogenase family protein [Paraglaciecola aquimarina]MDU0355037.1 tryptophan halogenase family protein [Paraglaciecola aquimarina]
MSKPIKSIVIVGGGTAGWLTAGTIAAKLKQQNKQGCSITLIESPNVPIIGVGEGTWPTMRRTLKKMGIRETDFIRQCNVTFKQGAKFAKWVTGTEDDFYYHPLVLPQDFDNFNMAEYFNNQGAQQAFSPLVCPQDALCEVGKAPKLITTAEYAGVANYAYHLDAGSFSTFLQQHCVKNLMVNHVLDHVVKVNNAENGDICSLTTQQHGELKADLFVDCTGFKSLLLGENQQVPFKSCADVLFVDKALALHVPYPEKQSPIASHTISTAQSNGWIWDIGLQTRRGVGHVYSSRHTSSDNAHQELLDYVGQSVSSPEKLSVREIDIEAGHREVFWKRNCVAVGLSAGFLEPLEASALVLVETSAEMIAEQLPVNRQTMDIVAKRFNNTFLYRWQRIIDFLKLHYMLSQRTDSQFWLDHRDPATIPDSLKELLTLWRYHVPWHDDFEHVKEVFPAASYQYVLYGMGFKTESSHLGVSNSYQEMAESLVEMNLQQTQKLLDILPSNRELLNKIHRYGLQPI